MTSSTTFSPYTYFQCPCTENNLPTRRVGDETAVDDEEDPLEDGRTFDPRALRSNYNLYPLEHLLYCEDCHQIRCPKCVLDEIVTWYCPNCLFEVPSSTVKTEGNRCTRSCFQCPVCIAPLSVSSLEAPPEGLGAEHATQTGPFVLFCPCCAWSSSENGIQFDKPQSIHAQLAKLKNGGESNMPPNNSRRGLQEVKGGLAESIGLEERDEIPHLVKPNEKFDPESQFNNLKSFYQAQLADSSPVSSLGFAGDYGYGSPSTLSRIMGLYTGGNMADKKSKSKAGVMREANTAAEGLQITASSDDQAVTKLRTQGWNSTSSLAQRKDPPNHHAHFTSDLLPIAYLLRTKRSKRCRTCRHILSKPEAKVSTTRFRIRLIALNYIPSITIKPLQPIATASSLLSSLKPMQFLLTFKNPLYDAVKITLGTPGQTPGRFQSKVTVLCPQFEVGANTDAWEEALREDGSKGGSGEKRRTKAEANEGQLQAEAGKVWEKGRNWVSVVVEVVPASLKTSGAGIVNTEGVKHEGPLREDDDIVEIPVFVRVEWESDPAQDETAGLSVSNKEKEVREKRELAYWCVLGLGRIGRD